MPERFPPIHPGSSLSVCLASSYLLAWVRVACHIWGVVLRSQALGGWAPAGQAQ